MFTSFMIVITFALQAIQSFKNLYGCKEKLGSTWHEIYMNMLKNVTYVKYPKLNKLKLHNY